MSDMPDFGAGSYGNTATDAPLPPSVRGLSERCLTLRQMWINICRQFLTSWDTSNLPSKWKPNAHFDGGRDTAGRTYRPIWPKLLKMLDDRMIPPRAFIIAQFEANRNRRSVPFPNCVAGAVGLQNYRDYCASMDVSCKMEISLQTQKLDSEIYKREIMGQDRTTALRDILFDDGLPMSVLFRYCAASRAHLEDVCDAYYADALSQYLMSPDAYDRDWGDYIPEDLQEGALLSRTRVAGKVGAR